MPIEHFERCEHRIVSLLVEAALEDTLHGISAEKDPAGKPKSMPKILHLFPPYPVSLNGTGWIAGTARIARHIAVHVLAPRRPLNSTASAWASTAEQVWVVGGSKNLSAEIHGKWLTPEEVERIRTMDRRCAYIRNGAGEMGLVTRIADSAVSPPESHRIRTRAAAKRRPIPLRQMGSASGVSLRGVIPGENLYGTLCSRESLRNGWFKVQATVRKSSHGVDNITSAMFEEKLEAELGRLSDDLLSRTYRCKPLKSMVIPKPDGGQRRLGIACIRDRVVMSACLLLLDPVFDPAFSHFSFGFRPHRNAHQALAVTRSFISTGVVSQVNP